MAFPTTISAGQTMIGIVRSVKALGLMGLEQIGKKPEIESLSLEEALRTKWETDALFVQYRRIDDRGQICTNWYRCNKPSLTSIQKEGGNLEATLIALEWDNTPHEPWTPEARAEWDDRFTAALNQVAMTIPSVANWYALYFTLRGFRAIWVLNQPLGVDEIEPKIKGLQEAFRKAGLKTDEKTADWTRLFRLPQVVREDQEPEYVNILHNDDYVPAINPEATPGLIVSEIPSIAVAGQMRVYAAALTAEMPFVEEDAKEYGPLALVYEVTKAGLSDTRLTEWGKLAKRLCSGREWYGCLFEKKSIASVGARDATLFKFVGGVIGTEALFKESTPEHIYGLFYRAIERLQHDSMMAGESLNWYAECWDMICRIWPLEERKKEIKALEKAAEGSDNQSKEDVLIQGMQKWCQAPELWSKDRATQMAFIRRHVVAALGSGKQYYPLQPDGWYSYGVVCKEFLVNKLSSYGMDFVLDLTIETKLGTKPIPIPTLLNNHSTIIHGVRSELVEGAFIKNMDTDEATFVQPMYRRNPRLKPRFDPEVDEWLRSFGNERLLDWLALCVDFEKRLVMLSIAGPGSIGKSLLIQGMVETLENPIRGTEKDLGKFGQNLPKTPFVAIDEGLFEGGGNGGKEISAAIREFIGGGEMASEKKHMAVTGVVTKGRVIVMANNTDVIAKLCGAGRDQSKEDVEAIEMRTFHMDITTTAPRDFLATVKVDAEGHKWVHGNDPDKDFVIARHILWLNANRKVPEPKNRRFAMDGKIPDTVKAAMEKRTPNVDLCVEAIIHMIERPQPKEIADFMVVDEKRQCIYVVASSVRKAYEALGQKGLERDMSINRIGSALAWLRKEGTTNKVPKVLTRANGTRTTPQRWSEITFERLIRGATDYGFMATKLRSMYTGQIEVEEE